MDVRIIDQKTFQQEISELKVPVGNKEKEWVATKPNDNHNKIIFFINILF